MRLLMVLAATAALVLTCAAVATAGRFGTRTFYLAVHPRQCLVTAKSSPKWVQVVPCSNPKHDMEVYAIAHGGWGHATPPTAARGLALARSLCLAAYQRLTGHALGATEGWNAFWPDPGTETARYGDKIVCSLRRWPSLGPLGRGWHVH